MGGALVSGGLAAATLLTGCSAGEEAMQARVNELEQRLAQMERDSGRSVVRMEDVNDRISLLVDRVETNRLALERRGIARPLPVVVATPGQGAQVGSWSPPPYTPPAAPSGGPMDGGYKKLDFDESRIKARIAVPSTGIERAAAATAQRRVQPAQESEGGAYEDVTITEDDFQRFVDSDGGSSSDSIRRASPSGQGGSAMKSAGGGSKHAPQPDVVHDEKLPVVKTTPVGEATRDKEEVPSTPMEAYKGALSKYRAGRYGEALSDFKRYLDMGPSEDYLDNAYYWIGECSYGLGEFKQAIAQFDRVIKETPGGNKVPDSMLKAAMAYIRIGSPSDARGILLNLVETYPSTNAAKLATEKLKELD